MENIVPKLDSIANHLESKGYLKEAKEIDIISNTIEAAEEAQSQTVGINDFVKRQTKSDFVGTKITPAQLENYRKEAERQAKAGQLKKGYMDGVKIAVLKDPSILSPVVKITPQNEKFLQTETTKRRDFEDEYEHRFFDKKDVKGTPSHHIDVVLYSKKQLESEAC